MNFFDLLEYIIDLRATSVLNSIGHISWTGTRNHTVRLKHRHRTGSVRDMGGYIEET